MKTQTAQWMGRPILDAKHVHDLEQRAAVHEFGESRLPRHAAEDQAYREYVRDRRLESAAHHLQGMKAAQAVGDMESARQHGMMYELHMKSVGLDPMQPPSQEVTSKLRGEQPPKVYRFKAHTGDYYALPDVPQEGVGMEKSEPEAFDPKSGKPKSKVCRCTAYSFPHRHSGGKCKPKE